MGCLINDVRTGFIGEFLPTLWHEMKTAKNALPLKQQNPVFAPLE